MCRCRRNIGFSWLEVSIKESIVYCLAIGQQDHAQVAILELWNLRPASDATISLNMLANRSSNRALNPVVANYGSIAAGSDGGEIRGDFHAATVADGCNICRRGLMERCS